MITLFFVTHGFSGAATYAGQMISELRKLDDFAVCEVSVDNRDVHEFMVFDLSGESASGKGYRFLFPHRSQTGGVPKISPEFYLLEPYIDLSHPVIFHYNSERQVRLAAKVAELSGVRTVLTCHFLSGIHTWQYLRNGKYIFDDPLSDYSRMLEHCSRVICVTDFARRCVETVASGDKLSVIHNGCAGIRRRRTPSLRQKYGFPADDLIILYAGRVNDAKGVPTLLKAFDRLAGRYPRVRLLVAGQGDIAPSLERVRRHYARITFTGNVDRHTLGEFYAISDIGVVPSKFEQCGYVMLEMMLNGLPVVASSVPGLNEVAREGENALTVPVRALRGEKLSLDEHRLFEALERLVCDPALRLRLGRNGRRLWGREFRVKQMTGRTIALYRNLCGDAFPVF